MERISQPPGRFVASIFQTSRALSTAAGTVENAVPN
jgi:hypothetical protein